MGVSLITVADVQNELPELLLDATTHPSAAQVQGFIDAVEAEVRAHAEAAGVDWPRDPSSTAAAMLRATILEGVVAKVLRARYALAPAEMQPEALKLAAQSYEKRLSQIGTLVRGMRQAQAQAQAGAGAGAHEDAPSLGHPALPDAPTLTGSFAGWVLAREWAATREWRRGAW
jgi:hypothetical protein